MPKKIMTFGFPEKIGRDLQKAAKEEGRTVSELVGEAVRQYRAIRTFKAIASEGRRLAKKKRLTEKAFEASLAR